MRLESPVKRGLATVGLTVALFVPSVLFPPAARGEAGKRIAAFATLGIISPADASYRDIYGGSSFHLEGGIRIAIRDGWFAWAGFGRFGDSGTIPGSGEGRARQSQLSAGGGYGFLLAGLWPLDLRAGICSLHYREEALEASVSGSSPGFRVDADVAWPLGRGLEALASAGYVAGRNKREDVVLKLGGFRTGIGLRYAF